MKKIIFLIALFGFGTLSYAQILPGFSIGPKIGVTFSKFTTDQNEIEESIRTTFHYGAFARFGEIIYLQPELLIKNRQGALKNSNSASDVTIKLNTVDVPVLLGIRLVNAKLVNGRIMAGPVASIAINREVSLGDIDFTKDDLKSLNWGFQFGGGVDLLMFTIDLRYEVGLSDMSDIDSFDLKNNILTLGIGWKIL